MEKTLNNMIDIMYDLKEIRVRVETYRDCVDRGINVNTTAEAEGYSKVKLAENLFEYLVDAKHDFDRVVDYIKNAEEFLDKAIDEAEYENVAGKIR
jgi:hypothetical protein